MGNEGTMCVIRSDDELCNLLDGMRRSRELEVFMDDDPARY